MEVQIIKRDSILNGVTSTVKAIDSEAKIYLYGSRARLDYTEHSDWDFFVATSLSNTREVEDNLIDALYDLMLEHDELIQVFVSPKSSWEKGLSPSPIYDNIRKEGIEL